MILCYNNSMKIFIKIVFIFFLLANTVQAVTFDVLVLPTDIFQIKENYYGFDEVSEIVANDIIRNFNNSNGKINSPKLYSVKEKFSQNQQLKQSVQNALEKYKTSGAIDYDTFKNAGNLFDCKSVLLISSSVITNKNSQKRSIWEVLEISTAFDISYPYRLETSVVLLDNVNNLVMWSNNFSTKISNNNNVFAAKNYAQANAQYEKIKLYSSTVVAPSASQNITLRFFPKSIRPVLREIKENTGGALRYERTIPEKPRQNNLRPKEDFYGEMLYGL